MQARMFSIHPLLKILAERRHPRILTISGGLVFVVLLLCTFASGVSGNSGLNPAPFVADVNADRLTVQVENIPLPDVLKKISDQTRGKIILHTPPEEIQVSADFSDLSLEEGIRQLLKRYNCAIIFRPGRLNTDAQDMEIFIFKKEGDVSNRYAKHQIILPQTIPESEGDKFSSLINALDDPDDEIRENAVDELAELKDQRAAEHLGWVLTKDRDPDIRETAAEALGDIGGEAAVASLIKATADRDEDVRESALDSLGQIGEQRAIPAYGYGADGKNFRCDFPDEIIHIIAFLRLYRRLTKSDRIHASRHCNGDGSVTEENSKCMILLRRESVFLL